MKAGPGPLEMEMKRGRKARLGRARQQFDGTHEDARTSRAVADEDVAAWHNRLSRHEALSEWPPDASPPARAEGAVVRAEHG